MYDGLLPDQADGMSVDNLTKAAKELARACPSLRLISFCVEFRGIYAQYAPQDSQNEYMEPVSEFIEELDGRPIRFWLPSEEPHVAAERYQGCCSRVQEIWDDGDVDGRNELGLEDGDVYGGSERSWDDEIEGNSN
jgi:hypothetical protein